ncbi:branched-chain amino acid ABC transporter permease [Mesorhizobium sp. L-8-10]|uniref:branched-chain amino acid ABC transporter permease n=1 Tax=Mesorhizobium sp. L-8-10 TaxID=2744523 RepID=UPI001926504E|nr:branched-chain amino acid ABC transporter permease [Mesorhizobium sp. L-8-10]BCH32185.1 branched-chain amino acid ABC transporter permease [Mesorhizobium sp. L-8-10]
MAETLAGQARQVTAPASRRYRIATQTRASRIAAILGAAFLAFLFAVPFLAGRALIQDLFFVLTMLCLAQYWNLLAGFAGLVSVGQQAFVGLGAYLMFAFVILPGLDPVLSILLAGLVSAVVAMPTAFVVFRLRGPYFAIGTWVVAEVFRLLAAQYKALGGGTGTSLPRSATNDSFLVVHVADWLDLRSAAARDVVTYWLALVLAVFTVLLIYRVLRSRAGLALAAIRDSEPAASSVGVDAMRTKLWVYMLCAFGTGMTGALIYLQTARISPDAAFSVLDWTAMVIFIVVIGGIGSIEGPIVGVVVFFALQDQLAGFGPWYLMLLGALAIVVMMFFPKGLWGTLADRYDLHLFPVRRRFEMLTRSEIAGGK